MKTVSRERYLFLTPRRFAANAPAARLLSGLRVDLRRHRGCFVLLATIWALACWRLFVEPTPLVPLLFSWTPSLPYRVAVYAPAARALVRGDYVVFSYGGSAVAAYPGLARQPFFKRIVGMPGDRISVLGRRVYINGQAVGEAKPHTFDGRPLHPIESGRIPARHYYAQGTLADSFDSRYREVGLVPADAIVARVIPLF